MTIDLHELLSYVAQGGVPAVVLVMELRQWRGLLDRWLLALQGAKIVCTVEPISPSSAPASTTAAAPPRPVAVG